MLKVESVCDIRDRGRLIGFAKWPYRQVPSTGAIVHVLRGSREFVIRGVDKWAICRESWKGCPIGLLISVAADVVAGDVAWFAADTVRALSLSPVDALAIAVDSDHPNASDRERLGVAMQRNRGSMNPNFVVEALARARSVRACPGDEHDPNDDRTCKRCGASVCSGCGRAFDIACDACDDVESYSDAEPCD